MDIWQCGGGGSNHKLKTFLGYVARPLQNLVWIGPAILEK